MIAETELLGDPRQGFLPDQGSVTTCQSAFILVGELLYQQVGNDHPQYPIPEELEAFVG